MASESEMQAEIDRLANLLRNTTYDVQCPSCKRDWTIQPSDEHGEHRCVCGCLFEWEAELHVEVTTVERGCPEREPLTDLTGCDV